MNIQSEKLKLVKRLLDIDDESVLKQVKDVFENYDKDFGQIYLNTSKAVSSAAKFKFTRACLPPMMR